jgi:transcriptional regulator with XRE-family HTH domain
METETAPLPKTEATRQDYSPSRLLDMVLAHSGAKSDAELAIRLGVNRAIIRKIRDGRLGVTPSILFWLQEATTLSVSELRVILGDRRASLRPACRLL